MSDAPLRALPSVDALLRLDPIRALLAEFDRHAVVRLVRDEVQRTREEIRTGAPGVSPEDIAGRVTRRVALYWQPSPTRFLNATGVILHTNAGRAPLSDLALRAMTEAAAYSDLEFDRTTGDRGSRLTAIREQLFALTGAEGAHVTLNAASALLLTLTALARGREVIVSRGQAVEIGGGFRVPSILRQSGAKLVEVGTTNRTRLADYSDAITTRTAAILHVHTSNFRVIGFTEDVPLPDLALLARERDLVLIDDNGSGSLLDTARFGLAHEPTPVESLHAGSNLVIFSGDKLLGGPQAGIVLGTGASVAQLARHQLARALRPDKITLAALSATLIAYLRGTAEHDLPIWRSIASTENQIAERAQKWRDRASARRLEVDLIAGESTVGGGSLPGETLPTTLIRLPRSCTSRMLLGAPYPILTRTQDDRVHLDLRTIPPHQDDLLLDTIAGAVLGTGPRP